MLSDSVVHIIGILVPLAHILGVLNALHAVLRVRTSQGAIAWSLCLLLFPYLSLPLYWIFGPRRFFSYQRKIRAARETFEAEIAQSLQPIRNLRQPLEPPLADDQKFLEEIALWNFTNGNRLELLDDNQRFFDTLFEAVERAEEYILIAFYIVRNDELAERFVQRLAEKAHAGLRVYFMFDQIGCYFLDQDIFDELRAAGGQVEEFRTNQGVRNRLRLNFRNHRKMVVIDGKSAFVGGHNIGLEYTGRTEAFPDWRDTSIRIDGPAALGVQAVFAQDWYWLRSEIPPVAWEPRNYDGDALALPVQTGPVDESDSCLLYMLDLLNIAETRIWVASPYLVPDEALCNALILAQRRGLDVRVLVPEIWDHFVVGLASSSYARELAAAGVPVFRYQPGFMHQKVILIDDTIASIGTANFDNRSLRLNFELSVMSIDHAFASEVEEMLERDFRNSSRVSENELDEISIFKRLPSQIGRLFAPIL